MKMSDFIDLLRSSAVTQGILSIMIIGGWIYMLVTGVPVPPAYDSIVGLVVGFFFGSKVATAIYPRSGGS